MTDLSTFYGVDGSEAPSAALKELVEVRSRYHHLCNEIIKPRSQIRETRYFWRKWRKLLGATLTIIVIEARDRCFRNLQTGEERNYFSMSLDEFASACDISERTLRRTLKHEHAEKFIRVEATYRYDAILKKKVRGPNRFEVFLDDPLTPEDQSLLAEKLNQQELQSLLGQGVVDLAKYVALKGVSSTGQNVRKVDADQPDRMTVRYSPAKTVEDHSNFDQTVTVSVRANSAESHDKHLADSVTERCPDNVADILQKPPPLKNTFSTLASTTTDTTDQLYECTEDVQQGTISDTVAAVLEKFNHCISEQTILRLIEETSEDNVRQQLDWFDHRDSSWATRGPAAAFVTYCKQQAGEPEAVARDTMIAQRKRTEQEQEQRREAYEAFVQAEYERITSELPTEAVAELKVSVMQELKKSPFWRDVEEESPVFQANLQARVLELGGVPKLEEWLGETQ